jgi:hypothetical protein
MTQQREFASGQDTRHTAKQIHNLVNQAFPNKGEYISEVMKRFLKVFKRKRLEIAASPWLFHWDNVQDGAGTGATEYRRKRVCRSLPEVATSSWKVHSPPVWICQEILKNKVPPISSSFCFIWPFAFVIEPTSYIHPSKTLCTGVYKSQVHK